MTKHRRMPYQGNQSRRRQRAAMPNRKGGRRKHNGGGQAGPVSIGGRMSEEVERADIRARSIAEVKQLIASARRRVQDGQIEIEAMEARLQELERRERE